MAYEKKECLEAVESILTEAGFAVSLLCCSRPSCFDFAARKGEEQIFIKFERDIEKLSSDNSHELRVISEGFSAASLLVGEETRGKALSDDTVYTRYDARRHFKDFEERSPSQHPAAHPVQSWGLLC